MKYQARGIIQAFTSVYKRLQAFTSVYKRLQAFTSVLRKGLFHASRLATGRSNRQTIKRGF